MRRTRSIGLGLMLCTSILLPLMSDGVAGAATRSQTRAVATAKSYLSYQAFSLAGLVDQLKFEKFSAADATYGAAHSGGDWNKEALLSAKEYLSSSAFSQSGLVQQLVSAEKFTPAQANYGVAHCGANWNTQAYKSAKEYLSSQSFSLSGLIEQLKFEGFTAAQASYGARKAY